MDDLNRVVSAFAHSLDDPSGDVLSRLRAVGTLNDSDWAEILQWLREAMVFLGEPNPTLTRSESGRLVLDPDADPRNSNWLRVSAAMRKTRRHLPMWAAMWLWRLGCERDTSFWSSVEQVAAELGYPPYPPPAGRRRDR